MRKSHLVMCVLGSIGFVVIGLSSGLFTKSHTYVASQTVSTTADGKKTVDLRHGEVSSGLMLDWSSGVALIYTSVDLVQSNGIVLPSVSTRTWRLGL